MLKFRFDNIPSKPVHLAQKYALIPSILGESAADALFEAKDTRKALIRLIKLWRERVGQLRKLEWRPVSKRGWIHHVNCPPPFAYTRERSRPCTKYLVCPFCWSRGVVAETYKRAEFSLYGTHRKYKTDPQSGENVVIKPKMWDLVEIVEQRYVSRISRNKPTINKLVKKGVVAKRLYHNLLEAESFGDYGLVTVEPLPDNDKDWLVMQRYLLLINPGLVDDVLPETSQTTMVHRHKFGVSRETLAAAVGRVCRYPSGMLLGSPEDVLQVIHARQGDKITTNDNKNKRGVTPRLSGYYGTLRNKAARERTSALEMEESNGTSLS